MVIDDQDFPAFEIPSLEVHLYLGRRFAYLRTRDDLIVFEKSRKCFLGSCIGKEDNRFHIPPLVGFEPATFMRRVMAKQEVRWGTPSYSP